MAQDVAGTLACNTGPNGNDAGNFCSNQGVDAGYIVAVNIEHALGDHGGSNAASVKLRDVAEPLTRSEHKGHTLVLGYESGPGYWMLGEKASALRAEGENRPSRPSHVIAFANRTGDGVNLPEVMPGGVAPAPTGGRTDAINVCVPIQEVGKRTGPSSTGDVRAGIGLGQNGDPMFTLQAGAQHGGLAYGIKSDAVDRSGEGRDGSAAPRSGLGIVDELSPTLKARSSNSAAVTTDTRAPMCVRRLTPRECERLQGVDDDYTAITYRGKPAADGPRYKALGNGMAVPVMRWIGARIIANSDR